LDPSALGVTARVASALIRPLVAKLFVQEGSGADLVDKPVRVSSLVSWRGEKRSLGQRDVHEISKKLVQRVVDANPYEPAVAEGDRRAVVDALAKTLLALGDVDMEDIQAVRLGHAELARKLAAAAPDPTRYLSRDATDLYWSLLDVSCLHILHFFTQRSTFIPHTLVAQTRLIDQTLRRVDALTARLPDPTSQDAEFERRYLAHVAGKYGKLSIFGLDFSRPGRAQWPLDTAYLSLELTSQNRSDAALPAYRLRVEQALSGQGRALLRGAAGSGKTTLVQWLAVSAAQQQFGHELASLRGRVPFVIPLRSLARQGTPPRPEQFLATSGSLLHGVQPAGWVDRILHSGRGMLLVDGVDEVTEAKRLLTRQWLRDLQELYPRTFFLVTTRPSAVPVGWLTDGESDGEFVEFDLLPLNRHDVDKFVDRWHDAALTTTDQADEQSEVEWCRTSLHETLRRKSDLYRLATNPLMCALICALHRDRHSHLPQGRMDLYAAALSMLLVRRDKERDVTAPEGVQPTEEQQVQLLQRLAYWLIRNGRSEATQSIAVRIIRERLPTMPQMAPHDGAEQVFRHLLLRSGLLREPSPETVDFIHRTFQDYLGAKAAVEAEDLDLLAQHAGDDQWEDVVRMAVGHARERERAYLLRRLVNIGDQRPGLRRRYHLLAAASLENATTLDPAVRAEVTSRASFLIPPENFEDAQHLASAGAVVLDVLPDPSGMTVEQAKATVRTIALIGGEVALNELRAYSHSPVAEIRQALVETWEYFDAAAFAETILADCPRSDVIVHITSPEQLGYLPLLGTVPNVCLPALTPFGPDIADTLAPHAVVSLTIGSPGCRNLALPVLSALPQLRHLRVRGSERLSDLASLAESRIDQLMLEEVPMAFDFAALAAVPTLRMLNLSFTDVVEFPQAPLPGIVSLKIRGVLEAEQLPPFLQVFPDLQELELHLTRRPRRAPVFLSGVSGIARVRLAFQHSGKLHGLEQLDPGQVTIVTEGRRATGRLKLFRERDGAP